MSNRTRLLLDVSALAALFVADNFRLTGIDIHEWLSLGLACLVFVHLVLNWDWCVDVVRRFLGKLRAARRVNLVIDVALFLSFVTVTLSGFLISRAILGALGLHAQAAPVWRALHSLSAQTTIWLFAAHLGMHASWIAEQLTGLFSRHARPSLPDRADAVQTAEVA